MAVRLAILVSVALAFVMPIAAAAGPCPSPLGSIVPSSISLFGDNGAVADPAGEFWIFVGDMFDTPCPRATVVLDFGDCPDIGICLDQLDPSLTVACPPGAKTVSGPAGADGFFVHSLIGGAAGGSATSSPPSCAKVYADGVLLGNVNVAAYDLDWGDGVGANDLSLWLTDFGTGNYYPRSDYDFSIGVGANDLSLWLDVFGSGNSSNGCVVIGPCN